MVQAGLAMNQTSTVFHTLQPLKVLPLRFSGHEALRKKLEKKSSGELKVTAVSTPAAVRKAKEPFDIKQLVGRRNMLQDAATPAPRVKTTNDEPANIPQKDRFMNNPSGWQQHETIADFMRRAPVNDPSTADLGM